MLAQIEVATELANNILQAQLGQIIGLVLVSITLVLGVFAIIFFRIINVVARQTDAMAKKTENDSKLIENMQITNRAIEHLANAMDEQTLTLHRINDGMKENVALNTERNARSDVMATAISTLSSDTKEGRQAAVDEVKTAVAAEMKQRDPKVDRLTELLVSVNEKLDEALRLLREKSPEP